MVHAAIMNHGEEENNKPWVVSLDVGRKASRRLPALKVKEEW